MKKPSSSGRSRLLFIGSVMLVGVGLYGSSGTVVSSQKSVVTDRTPEPIAVAPPDDRSPDMVSGVSYHNDVSPPLRKLKQLPLRGEIEDENPHEANKNPKLNLWHFDAYDPVIQGRFFENLLEPKMPSPILNFDGIAFPGVVCNCAPPDTDGEVGATQYVQIVNKGYQVFNKSTGASVLGPASIVSLWSGFGGVCETNGDGDPVVLYDQLANRWIITEFAGGGGVPTDECIAVSTTSDATGSYNRYGFHLGSSFFDYPKLGVWPDGYYMSMDVFNAAGTTSLGPQPFAFDRAKMLTGQAATFVTTSGPLAPTNDSFKPADLDGSALPSAGAPDTFVSFPGGGNYVVYHFHTDFATPANSTFTTFATLPAAGFTELCPSTRACVPQLGGSGVDSLDGIGDRLMHRLAYRNFGDHEAIVGNYSVSAGGVSGIRWFELRNVSAGPATVFQESTYQPDTTWRWMGSAAMDALGNIAIGYSASSSAINPQIRYTGRLKSDPLNTLAQGETTMFAGTGSQTGTNNRWGDYSALTVDPTDDCTFWYTQEYYSTTTTFGWRTRIGNFKYPTCTTGATGTFHFAVTDCSTNAPAAGAAVSIDGNFVGQTLADGTLDVTLGTGSHNYSITKNGYATTPGSATVSANTITPVALCLTGVPIIAPNGPATLVSDSGGNGKIDPGELVTVSVPLINNGAGATNSLTATLQTGGGVSSVAGTNPQNYGALAAGGGSATQPYSFRVSSSTTCGSNITLTFALQDGASNLGTAVFTLPTGTVPTPLSQNFDGVAAPALPAGWTTARTGTLPLWVTSATSPDTGSNDAFAQDISSIATTELISPQFAVPLGSGTISFQNLYNMEVSGDGTTGFDGMVLEYALDGSTTFQDITTGGNAFTSGGYNRTISSTHSSPIAGRAAWSGLSAGTTAAPAYITSTIAIPTGAAGHNMQLKWRVATDSGFTASGAAGVRIDSLTVMGPIGCQITTAARVQISGRVLTANGAGLRNAVVSIRDQNGNTRTAITTAFGYYHFEQVVLGNYVVGVASRLYAYSPRLVDVNDSLANIDFLPRQ